MRPMPLGYSRQRELVSRRRARLAAPVRDLSSRPSNSFEGQTQVIGKSLFIEHDARERRADFAPARLPLAGTPHRRCICVN